MTARGVRITAACAALLCGASSTGGCTTGEPVRPPPPSPVPVAGAAVEPRADLARRVAAAKDLRFTAAYTWTGAGARRTVTVTVATDGTWRVDVPGGAHGGRTKVSLVGRPEGVYQCAPAGCVRIARGAATVPAAYDVKVHHPFTDWPAVLTDRNAALSVATSTPLANAPGACFAVEPTTVAVAPPIPSSTFCYDDTGLPTAVKATFGTLVLAGAAQPAPPTAVLTGPVTNGPALGTAAPPAAASSPASPRPAPR